MDEHSNSSDIILTEKLYSLFFCFFRSRGGSFKALMMSEAAEGTTEIVACRF